MTDIQKASRYFYLQRMGYGGRVKARSFGVGVQRKSRINLIKLEKIIKEVHKRLVMTTIENLPWQELINRYDRKESFFYIDPPYYKCPYYNHNMKYEDFKELADSLKNIKGKFILSINNTPEMQEVLGGFKIQEVKLRYSISKKEKTVGKELLISGRN